MGIIQSSQDINALYKAFFEISSDFKLLHGILVNAKDGKKHVHLLTEGNVTEEVRDRFRKFLIAADSEISLVNFLETDDRASKLKVMREIKIYQPITIEDLAMHLNARNIRLELAALKNMIDSLRKEGHIYRNSTGTYTLREAALKTVPHGPSKTSTDVARALELGKRKW
ncbi:MAG: hypothetical protein DI585_01430 [Pseudomonas fluorescens]|nr:MAG: hypothetical protein DI585_01430 [Pseudomonas fluorescens]